MNTAASNPLLASAHRDVLQANPETSDSKESLLNELQNRGRAAVGSKAWMDAKLLYEKAVTVCASFDENETEQLKKASLFQANLSLVLKNMGEMEAARLAAQEATMSDATYVKGWWRLGQALSALHRPKDALEALEKAKSLEPNNKALLKECDKIASQVKEEEELLEIKAATAATETAAAAAADENGDAMQVDSPDTPTTVKKKTIKNGKTTTATTTLHSNATITTFETMQVDDEEEEKSIFTKSDAVRGYKVVNGKKTSYFHNELSEEAKSLIGDIAPKKLDLPGSTTPTPMVVAAATANGTGVAAAPTTSAWNQAGTWEEKDVSKWATEQLKQAVLQTSFALPASSPAPNALVTVSQVTKLEGHASVAVARGKTRYIYEYALTLEWQVQATENGLDCRGKVSIPDIDGTIELGEGYDMADFVIEQANDETVRPLLDRFVHRGGFKEALNESIDDWVRCFKKTYEMK
jgi:Activator of Hsp90 ATPase, N-terminal/Tetratricopeptide repeat